MVARIGKYYVFYRHMLYGSALCIGTIIGTNGIINTWMPSLCLIIGTLLMSVSVFVTVTVNMYPEEFEREMKERKLNDHLPSSGPDTSD